jgi:hypothetical protein
MPDREGSAPRGRLGTVVGMLVNRFEEAIYGIAFLLLAAAAVLASILRETRAFGCVDTRKCLSCKA